MNLISSYKNVKKGLICMWFFIVIILVITLFFLYMNKESEKIFRQIKEKIINDYQKNFRYLNLNILEVHQITATEQRNFGHLFLVIMTQNNKFCPCISEIIIERNIIHHRRLDTETRHKFLHSNPQYLLSLQRHMMKYKELIGKEYKELLSLDYKYYEELLDVDDMFLYF